MPLFNVIIFYNSFIRFRIVFTINRRWAALPIRSKLCLEVIVEAGVEVTLRLMFCARVVFVKFLQNIPNLRIVVLFLFFFLFFYYVRLAILDFLIRFWNMKKFDLFWFEYENYDFVLYQGILYFFSVSLIWSNQKYSL